MMKNQRISLDGDWKLTYVENSRFVREGKDVSTPDAVNQTLWHSVDAKVPGNFEIDFERAGLIGDPFFAANFTENYKYECLHLIYTRSFVLDFEPDENTVLTFEGIDTVADIYVNGKKIGSPDNMLIAHTFENANLKKGENAIVVHIRPTCIESRKYEIPFTSYNHSPNGFELLWIRKAPHMGGWDIMPRIISGGIWKPCYIEQRKRDRILDLAPFVSSIDKASGRVGLTFMFNLALEADDLREYSMDIIGVCGDSRFEKKVGRFWHTGGSIALTVENARLWWPRNYGDPNLYDITATLYKNGEAVHEMRFRYGIRTVYLDRTSTTDENGSGEFCFVINGKKVFWMGTNWVPVDALHSRDVERLPEIMPMITDIGCNCVRCWGGNVYENDIFYDFCDENGIMIWQDFTHACAINPQVPEYFAKFAVEVEAVVKRLRNHASVIAWAGDNEVDDAYYWTSIGFPRDPNENRLTRRVIPDVLAAHDFTRPYIPSSPYKDEEAYRTGKHTPEEHLWGPRDYFKGKFYGQSVCHFASETGYHGCPSPESLKRFIRKDQLWHWRKEPGSDLPKPDWGVHAAAPDPNFDPNFYRIRLMSNQVKTLFVKFREDEEAQGLDAFARASQISQAEAKKYFIERFRVSKWRRTGIIWWNLIDGWPQISDAVVDYYGTKKLAYHYIKRSQQPLCLIFDEPKDGCLPLAIASDLQEDVTVRCRVTDLTAGNVIYDSVTLSHANSAEVIWQKPIKEGEKHFYFMEWEYENAKGETVRGRNHYMTNIIDIDYDAYIGYMKQVGFYDEFEGFDA